MPKGGKGLFFMEPGLRLPAFASCKCIRVLLAAAPTTSPSIRRWRRSSLLQITWKIATSDKKRKKK